MKVNMIIVVEWITLADEIKTLITVGLNKMFRCSDVQERRPERKMWLRRAGSYLLSQAQGRSPVS